MEGTLPVQPIVMANKMACIVGGGVTWPKEAAPLMELMLTLEDIKPDAQCF